jgi:hypothetical protein
MPWFYFIYDGYGGKTIGGYYDLFSEAQDIVDSINAGSGSASDPFQAADGYHTTFDKRKSILTVGQDGSTVEVEF